MPSNFITKAEVIDIAFERGKLREEYIKDAKVEICEEQFIRPVLGSDLYEHLNQDNANLNADETALKVLLKKAIAYYVKYECLPDISLQVGNKGVQLGETDYSQVASDTQRGVLRETALNNGHTLINRAVRHIESNQGKFSLYKKSGNVKNRIQKRGGLIL